MNEQTKMMLRVLIDGGCLSNGYRLLDQNRNVVAKISARTFRKHKHLFRKSGIVYLINKSKVRQQHGNSFIKKQYKKIQNGIRSNQPDAGIQV